MAQINSVRASNPDIFISFKCADTNKDFILQIDNGAQISIMRKSKLPEGIKMNEAEKKKHFLVLKKLELIQAVLALPLYHLKWEIEFVMHVFTLLMIHGMLYQKME